MKDSDAWLAKLTAENEMLGARAHEAVDAQQQQWPAASGGPQASSEQVLAIVAEHLSCWPHALPAGIRILEVRQAYAKEDFEWVSGPCQCMPQLPPTMNSSCTTCLILPLQDNLKRLTLEGLEKGGTQLLRQHATQRYTTLLDQAGDVET